MIELPAAFLQLILSDSVTTSLKKSNPIFRSCLLKIATPATSRISIHSTRKGTDPKWINDSDSLLRPYPFPKLLKFPT